ncbi:L,D-transpeptidase [Deinococcus sp. GbtcB9]
MSHGCVNMTVDAARFVWEWATKGTEVWVHDWSRRHTRAADMEEAGC